MKPSRLREGDSVGIIAPAGPVERSELEPAIGLLESLGYRTVSSNRLYDRRGYLAGDDEVRLEALHVMFEKKEIKAILCARGGYGTLRILDRVDFELIRDHPKIIVGYSDITALLLSIYRHTGLVTFHGPVVREFPKNREQNLKAILELVRGETLPRLNMTNGNALREGKGTGILLGGNLSLMTSLIGTAFLPSLKGAIVFFEERDEPLYRIDRMLTHLRLSGVLNGIHGLVTGRFEACGNMDDINRLLLDAVMDQDIPVMTGLPVGHGRENITLPLGLKVSIDTDQMALSLTEPCVS
ncbi:MAG: LD-carboxypeptidase [Deltaproteobacteria bacterium]|nr:LD-carboxypeptidase [Deltaproteobacteria bacterium]